MIEFIKNELKNLKSPLYLNSIYISLSSVIVSLAGFIFWNLASRLYTSSDVGVASALVSALNLIISISLLGLNFSLIRFYPEYKERAISSAVLIVPGVAVIMSLLYTIIVSTTSDNLKILLHPMFLVAFIFFSIAGSLYYLLGTSLIATRRGRNYFIQSLFFSGRFVFLFLLGFLGVLGIFSSFGMGLALGTIYAGFILRDYLSFKIDREYLSASFKLSLANYLANILNMLPVNVMPTIVLSVLGKSQAAYYYIAFMIGNILLLVPNSINMSFFVEGSHGADVKTILKKALFASYLYLVLAVGFVWFFGGFLLRLFGEEYVVAFDLLRIVALSGFFAVIINFYVTVMNIKKNAKGVVVVNLLRAIIFLGLSYPLMIRFGIVGVGYAWIIAYGVLVPIIFLLAKNKISSLR
ncbi:lipopolysaccharide biosynthesis protein [Pyrococcus kukulkanii]|uniref:lipopolysaccharide biosynthesis protein n=1 Tax=Pyrococcus kukulkanii TaxID=1609559 RepID=UPI00356685C2